MCGPFKSAGFCEAGVWPFLGGKLHSKLTDMLGGNYLLHIQQTLAFNWSHVCVHLINVSPLFTLLLALFFSAEGNIRLFSFLAVLLSSASLVCTVCRLCIVCIVVGGNTIVESSFIPRPKQ